jgi:hypothetical protein
VALPIGLTRTVKNEDEWSTSKIPLGIIWGVVFGIVAVLIMIPLELEDKRAAMLDAFAKRFPIGMVMGTANLPLAAWLSGLIVGISLSLPDTR